MEEVMRSVVRIAQRHAPVASRAALEDPEVELQAAGLTSLELVGFILDLEQAFGISIGDDLMRPETFRNVSSVTEMVQAQLRGRDFPAAPTHSGR